MLKMKDVGDMKKRIRCTLGFHHWHYDCKAAFPDLYVEARCFYCGKEESITNLTPKEWFTFSMATVWDKHSSTLKQILKG